MDFCIHGYPMALLHALDPAIAAVVLPAAKAKGYTIICPTCLQQFPIPDITAGQKV